jgi:hypothetical protein
MNTRWTSLGTNRGRYLSPALLLAAALTLPATVQGQAAPAKAAPKTAAKLAPELEPKAVALLQAMSAKLAAAQSMAFTATITNEAPSRIGPPLAYTTVSEVIMQRPNRLRVITVGDSAASEFYYDGKTMTAYAPAEKLVAVAPAPPTLEAMLKQAYDNAAIYFPFDDVMAADPYKSIAADLNVAFVIGQSKVVGGVATDVVAVASDTLFLQIWIGADDKLPRMMRAVFRGDPLRLRHQLAMSNWKLDPVLAAESFASLDAAQATRIPFAAPQPPPASARNAGARAKPAARSASAAK